MREQQDYYFVEKLGALLAKRLRGTLTNDEQVYLDSWLNDQNLLTREHFDEMTDWVQIQAALTAMYAYDSNSALLDVQKKISVLSDQPSSIDEYNDKTARVRPVYSWLIAAASIGVAIGVLLLYRHSNSKEAPIEPLASVEKRYHNDVAPGKDRAILTLANGQQIILDSLSSGEIAKEGNASITKTADGQILYNMGKPKSDAISLNPSDAVLFNTVSTPRGAKYQIVLADGSKVWLNAGSKLRFPTTFDKKNRTVEISGEAYFDAAKNAANPLLVNITHPDDTTKIQVLGTEFNVRAYNDEKKQRISLIEGAVKVSNDSDQALLKVGRQAVITSAAALKVAAIDDMDEVIAWKMGLFKFHDATIQDILHEAARWYDIEVEYKDSITQKFVGTIPRSVNISVLLKILESTGWVHFTIDGKKITVLK